MPYSLRMEAGILRVEFHGTLTNQDLLVAAAEVAELEKSCSIVPHRTSDLRPVRRLEIDFPGVFALAEARRKLAFQNPFKSAIIASEIVHFGFARMFQTLNDHPQIVIAIFGGEDRALEWLGRADMLPPAELWQPRPDWHHKRDSRS